MKASDLLVRCLENEGVEYVFGVPGEENLDFLDSLSRSSIRFIVTRHEQGAGFMAATYGRLTGRAGVCLTTLGPGATNLMTAAAYAQLGGMPMVMITGQKPIRMRDQGEFQVIDVVEMMTPITKLTSQIVSGNAIPPQVREAFRVAQSERPGGAHLELPEDVAKEEAEGAPIGASFCRRPITEEKAVDHALRMLQEARHPLLLIGAGANRKRTAKMLRAFVDKQGIPFITTQMGKGVVDDLHPRCLGNAAMSSGDFVHRAIEGADLIINVGHDVVEKPPFIMYSGQRKVIHINFESASVDTVYFPHAEMVGDIANSIWQLNECLDPQSHWDFTAMMKTREAFHRHTGECCEDTRFPMLPQKIVADVREVVPEEGIVALDNGIYKIWFARNYPARWPNTVLLDNALASMGAGLPSAMAAKLVYPERNVLAICGDGGFMMTAHELETAVRLGLDLVVMILNDNAYGMIKWKQQHDDLADFGLDFSNPCFKTFAQSFGAKGHRVESTQELQTVLERCFEEGGVHVVDVPVDYSLNEKLLFDAIPARSSEL